MPTFTGDENNNILVGGAGDDRLLGLGGNDVLEGGAGSDALEGGTGDDFLCGGTGNDYYLVDSAGDRVAEAAGEGYDVVLAQASFALESGSHVEELRASDLAGTAALNLTGNELDQRVIGNSGNNVLKGGGGNDYVEGGAGSDALEGGTGDDFLRGGTGNDYYLVDSAGDRVAEAAGEGYDVVLAQASFALETGSHVEELRAFDLAGTAAFSLTGNELDQRVIGNNGDNVLKGGGGNDYVEGGAGSDALEGGTGDDFLRGGTGNDYYLVDSASDRVAEAAGEGYDVVLAQASFALEAGSHVEELRASDLAGTAALNLTGNELDQRVIGNSGNNVLKGGGGNDYVEGGAGSDALEGGTGDDFLRGGTGNDYYLVDSASDRVAEAAGEGYDVVLAQASFALEAGSHVEEFRASDLAGTAALNLTGNELDQRVIGNNGNNVLKGGGGNDYVEGGAGSDALEGGTGDDFLRGGTGNDYYLVDSAGDRVAEAAGEGYDVVLAQASFALESGSHVEELRASDLAGTAALNLTGNELDQRVIGNNGDNVLKGGGGNDYVEGGAGSDALEGGTGDDFLRGGTGNDYYLVDSASDRVAEAAGEGYDVVLAQASFALEAGSHVEELRASDLAGTAALNLTGNELDQRVIGNSGNNVLKGGGGNDYVEGGAGSDALEGGIGNDVLAGGAGADRFIFATAQSPNADTIVDFNVNEDRIVLNGDPGSAFSGLSTGILHYAYDPYAGAGGPTPGARFLYQSAAASISYDSADGSLYYDADGAGGQAAVIFARVAPGTALTTSNLTVEGAPNRAPVIISSDSASVVEQSPTSTIIYQTQAVDPDGDALAYFLGGPDRDYFTIDANGAVRLKAPASQFARASYEFSVQAYESNGEGVMKTVTLAVTSNPNAPPYSVTESEPNDSRTQATALNRDLFTVTSNNNLSNDRLPSAQITGSVSSPTDKDFFSITLNAGEQIILDIEGTTTLDSLVRLFDLYGNEIARNDDLGTFDPGSTPHQGVAHNMDSFLKFRVSDAGTYYFSVEAFAEASGASSQGNYTLNVSIGPRATAAQLIKEDIEALLSGVSWNTTSLTFGFPTSADQYPAGEAVDERATFEPLAANQQAAVRQILSQASNITNLSFAENAASPGSAQMRYGLTAASETAHAFYPGSGDGGDSWYNSVNGDYDQPVVGNYAWATFLHETGHALGLKHGHESPSLSPSRNSLEYSIMTYNSYVGAVTTGDGGYTNEEFGYPQTYMMFDIAALQFMYGADFGFNAGDSTYSWNPASGAFLINGATQYTPGANRVFMTVWDGGGTDTYDLSNYATSGGVQIDLRPGEWSLLSAVQRANLGDGRYAIGNVANALLYNDDPRSLIENAIGTSGDDALTGNSAVNRLTGGAGSDLFRFYNVAQSSRTAPDTITDFMSADRLDFSVMDANPATLADDTFYYLHTAAFTGQPAQLRHERVGNDVMVYADIDGDGVADLQVILQNAPDLFATNFLF